MMSADAFMADTDRKALEVLQKIPLYPTVIKKFHEYGADRWMYVHNMGLSVRCGPKQYPTLYKTMQECAAILDMPEPELYITNNPFPNAHAGGVERPYITLRSSIVETLNDEQLYHLIGHELGHIKCNHILFMSSFDIFLRGWMQFGPWVPGISEAAMIGLLAAYFEWMRQAEVSADRAGLLCAQNFDLSASANLHLTAGPNRLAHEANTEAFMDQARTYTDMSLMDGLGKMFYWMFFGIGISHPFPVHRVQQLEKWYQDGSYERILAGNYAKRPESA